MLYTVRPLERIYAVPGMFDPGRSEKEKDKEAIPQFKEVLLPNGRIVTRRDGDDEIIEHINSTDMKDYLNDQYAPGKSYKK